MPLLEVRELKTYYFTLRGPVKAVDGVSFDVEKGETVGLAGESGCGKTTTALSIIKLIPPPGKIIGGKIIFEGKDLVTMKDSDIRRIRWKGIAMIFQGAMNALNPVFKVGDQIAEAILAHEKNVSEKEAWERAEKLLEMVGIDPSRAQDYPHEFSGGMRQRAMIAMALACNPKLLIADEPATALDVIVQAQVLEVMRNLKTRLNLSMILITHDLSIIAEMCDRVAIMYAGKIVEYGSARDIFKNPQHPYTKGLIGAFPSIRGPKKSLQSIPGSPPNLLNPPPGCRFHPRCPQAMPICRKEEPKVVKLGGGHIVSCHLVG
ncbi:MAG: ABC transporter ATP-binding protein [archaeon GB-1867-035]|nr:ABC transporter ATP-binding protein [Candidatus Culexmicrobium profundum]